MKKRHIGEKKTSCKIEIDTIYRLTPMKKANIGLKKHTTLDLRRHVSLFFPLCLAFLRVSHSADFCQRISVFCFHPLPRISAFPCPCSAFPYTYHTIIAEQLNFHVLQHVYCLKLLKNVNI